MSAKKKRTAASASHAAAEGTKTEGAKTEGTKTEGTKPEGTHSEGASTLGPWATYWLAPVAAVRPWLLTKAVLLLLAFDVLHTHLGPAWRYGAAGFNVPHFAWMDALPLPTTAAYVAMLFFVSVASLVCALVPRPPRPLLVAIAALYTWGWSCSMHDSYQHHYLLSIVLVALAFSPTLDARRLFGDASTPADAPHGLVPRVHALSQTLLTSAAACVYTYTAVSKTEPDWLSGEAMRTITRNGETIPGAVDFAASLGIEGDDLWWWLGHGVVPAQLICACAYAAAPLLDGPSTQAERARFDALVGSLWRAGGRGPAMVGGAMVGLALGVVLGFATGLGGVGIFVSALGATLAGAAVFFDAATWRFVLAPFGRPTPRGVLAALGLVTALSFHVGAEYLDLSIGWFSAYMIVLACLTLLPARWLSLFAFAVTAPVRTHRIDWRAPQVLPRLVLATLAGGASLVVMGQLADLPGAMMACAAFTGVLVVVAGGAVGARLERADALPFALACTFAGVALSAWVHVSPARFDYYRFAGGDFRRRLDYDAALHAYERANAYAPLGQSRDDRIEEMREQIRQRRGMPARETEE